LLNPCVFKLESNSLYPFMSLRNEPSHLDSLLSYVQWEFSKSFLKQLHHIHNSKRKQDNPSSFGIKAWLSWIWRFSCANLCFGGLFGSETSRLFGVQDSVHINFPLHLRLKYLKTLSLDICCLVKWKHEILVLMFPLAESLLRCYHAKIFLHMLKVFLKCS